MPVAGLNYSEFEAGLEKVEETEQEGQKSQGKTEAELKPDGDKEQRGHVQGAEGHRTKPNAEQNAEEARN